MCSPFHTALCSTMLQGPLGRGLDTTTALMYSEYCGMYSDIRQGPGGHTITTTALMYSMYMCTLQLLYIVQVNNCVLQSLSSVVSVQHCFVQTSRTCDGVICQYICYRQKGLLADHDPSTILMSNCGDFLYVGIWVMALNVC